MSRADIIRRAWTEYHAGKITLGDGTYLAQTFCRRHKPKGAKRT